MIVKVEAVSAQPGAGDRIRTYDLRITNALLYQLSYTGMGRDGKDFWHQSQGPSRNGSQYPGPWVIRPP